MNVTGVVSKPLWIHCQGSGYPSPRLFYFLTGDKGGELNQTFFKTLSNGTLYIPKLRAKDKGIYMCILKNDIDTPKTSKFYIRIKSKWYSCIISYKEQKTFLNLFYLLCTYTKQ